MIPFKVFFNKKYLAYKLSFEKVALKFSVTIDTYLDPYINLHPNKNTIIKFKQYIWGLYYFDITNIKHKIINNQVTYYTLPNTVDSNNA